MRGLLMAALAAVLSVTAAASDFATLVAEKSPVAFCVYPSALFNADLGKLLLEKFQQQNEYQSLNDFEQASGVKISDDVKRMVFVPLDETGENLYVVLDGKFDAQKIETAIAQAIESKGWKDYKAVDEAGVRKLSWTDDKGNNVLLAFVGADKIVISPTGESLQAGVAVVAGKAANAAGKPLFQRAAVKNGVAFVEGAGEVTAKMKESAPQAQGVESVVVTLAGLPDGNNNLSVAVRSESAESAKQQAQQWTMMKTFLAPSFPGVVEKITINDQDRDVILSLTFSQDEIAGLAGSLTGRGGDDEDDEIDDEAAEDAPEAIEENK
ncbi:MAG: hypothetical protein LBP75_01235 [Planctomycetota bacterium]|jgi:hypothetical protein|nr:hypothetical protein [Planctomycetota bacterium]